MLKNGRVLRCHGGDDHHISWLDGLHRGHAVRLDVDRPEGPLDTQPVERGARDQRRVMTGFDQACGQRSSNCSWSDERD